VNTADPTDPTYYLFTLRARTVICCLLCGRLSELPGDVANRYCSCCHLFHEAIAEGRRLLAAGGTHECHEWRTWHRECALCGAPVAAGPGEARGQA